MFLAKWFLTGIEFDLINACIFDCNVAKRAVRNSPNACPRSGGS
jgi:hypothetical protein